MSYKEKYLKYKTKYSLLKEQIGGSFIIGDYDPASPTTLFDYDSVIANNILFFNSYYECFQDIFINFYENHSQYNLDNFFNYTSFLYNMLKIRVYLWSLESYTDSNNTFLRNTGAFITYPELAPAIEQIEPYTTTGGYDGNVTFITNPFVANFEFNIHNKLLEMIDQAHNNINASIPHMSQDMTNQLQTNKTDLQSIITDINRQGNRLPKDDSTFNKYLDTKITEITLNINRTRNGVNSPFRDDAMKDYKEYYRRIQIIERLKFEITKLYSELADVAAKIRDGDRYLSNDPNFGILHSRFQTEFDILEGQLQMHQII